ncbi:Rid family hydrolase [Paenibacillus qinlingensis]|uniref:2-iminobutanoate/2-iminopropanoate deaminase n=1 Tax=Paenibacillus qinlingensis TaxID=1837343 RepID=A0ABU1NSG2_9BACL|nr:Rid family hydrolase [Paenibacillus qinlingensis]MDR6550422.1 2-iminobutanoate/2-iminopropanoate deaminase [Paenibacillus qinlingensis]
MRKPVVTDTASKGDGPYSQAIISRGHVHVSGQGPLDLEGRIIGVSIEEQAEKTLDNVRLILEAAGSSLDDVVKVNVILSDMADFERFNAVYRSVFSAPYPARTCFGGQIDGILVEIDVVAELAEGKG